MTDTSFNGVGDGNGRMEDDGRQDLCPNVGGAENASDGDNVGAVSMVDGRQDLGPNLRITGWRQRRDTQQSIGRGLSMRQR